MKQVHDTRQEKQVIYAGPFLLWMTQFLFLLKMGSRRRLNFELDSPEALANLNRLSGCHQETVADDETVDHYLSHVAPKETHALRRRIMHRLVRMKALDGGRLMGRFLIAVDGTGQLHFHERHCEHCLTMTSGGKTIYYHHILEAKLVTPEGLALSIGSEFIENSRAGASKQDCELRAFARLADQLQKDYPQLPMCLLLDALYANGPVFELCRKNHWNFITSFKKGSLPSLWREYVSLRRLSRHNRRRREAKAGKPAQHFAWVTPLEHRDERGHCHHLSAFQCLEKNEKGRWRRFAWLTDLPVNAASVEALSNRGGRVRWKIENEGFNIQKNGGFNLEHAYSLDDCQTKNFYVLMQIAHVILQLLEHGNLLGGDAKALFGSLADLARRLAESLRHYPISDEALDRTLAAAIRIPLDSG
jgi:hypothetical protein